MPKLKFKHIGLPELRKFLIYIIFISCFSVTSYPRGIRICLS